MRAPPSDRSVIRPSTRLRIPLTVTSIDTGVRLWPRAAGRRKLSMAGTICFRGKFSGNDVGSRRDNFAFRFGPACRYGRGMTDFPLHPSLRKPAHTAKAWPVAAESKLVTRYPAGNQGGGGGI